MNRYEPRSYQTATGAFANVMGCCDNGAYITYESHMQEIESLQERLKALESKQKESISIPISSIITDNVRDAISKMIFETANQVVGDIIKAGLDKYNCDPCHGTVDSIIDELAVGPGKTVNADFITAYDAAKKYEQDFSKANKLTGRAGFITLGSNFGEGRVAFHEASASNGNLGKWQVNPIADPGKEKVACVSGDGYNFITGAEYFCEFDSCESGKEPEVIYICSDAFVSDLGILRWTANKSNNGSTVTTYEARSLNGSTCGIFQIK